MNYITHNEAEERINLNMSSLRGYINCTYDDLTEAFGYPMEDGYDDYKSDAEWLIVFEDGTRASIYNWKNGKNYLGDDGLNVCDIKSWHIGGYDERAVQLVQDAVNTKTRQDYPQDQVVAFTA